MNTDVAWSRWGDLDPYFGVLSDARYRRSRLNDNLESFFESGERHVADLLDRADHACAPVGRDRALDFGCGVGRLSIPLARRFDTVVGVDISDAMLVEAERNAIAQGRDNISFVQSDDLVSQAPGTYQFVNSYIVFQHIPATRGLVIMANLIGKVAEGGVLSLHVCVANKGGSMARIADLMKRKVAGMAILANICARRPLHEPMMQMNNYDLGKVASLLAEAGFGSMLMEMERHGRFMTVNIITRRQRVP
jgi:trans-aconitate methyltransferase